MTRCGQRNSYEHFCEICQKKHKSKDHRLKEQCEFFVPPTRMSAPTDFAPPSNNAVWQPLTLKYGPLIKSRKASRAHACFAHLPDERDSHLDIRSYKVLYIFNSKNGSYIAKKYWIFGDERSHYAVTLGAAGLCAGFFGTTAVGAGVSSALY